MRILTCENTCTSTRSHTHDTHTDHFSQVVQYLHWLMETDFQKFNLVVLHLDKEIQS